MTEDAELLRRYAEERSEAAFAELVQRRLGLVYSVALRQTRDAHRAKDVAQSVFRDLARKAAALSRRPVLVGWLHRSARCAAADIVRAEQRRARREREAQLMQEIEGQCSDHAWAQIRPMLDEAMGDLNDLDRDAILLRFFDDRPFAEIGARLKLTDNAARMRVERALDKLHAALAKRGVTSTAATLGLALTGQTSFAVPAGLVAAVTETALSGALVSGGAAIVSFMGMTKLQMGLAAAVVMAGGTTMAVRHYHEGASHPAPSVPAIAPASAAPSGSTSDATVRPASSSLPTAIGSALVPNTGETTPTAAPSAPPAAKPLSRLVQQWIDLSSDPAFVISLAAEARGLTMQQYAALFAQLNLTPERQEAFAKLLDAKRQTAREVAVANFKSGMDPRLDIAAFDGRVTAAKNGLDAEIEVLLGPEAYLAFRDYDFTRGIATTFVRIERVVGGTADALTAAQTDRLRAFLRTTAGINYISPEQVAATREFLSPSQVGALQKALDEQQRIKLDRLLDSLPSFQDEK